VTRRLPADVEVRRSRPRAPDRPAPPPPSAELALALQRTVGNRQAAALLAVSRPAGPVLARMQIKYRPNRGDLNQIEKKARTKDAGVLMTLAGVVALAAGA
jgi:hypothetical protein